MKTSFCFFIVLFCVLGCSGDKELQGVINVALKKTSDKDILFDKRFTTFYFSSNEKAYPRYYKYLLKTLKGLPESDSLYVSYNNADFKKFLADLYQKGFIDIEKINHYKIDLLEEKSKPKQEQLNVVTYFKNSKQYLIVDENMNWDFSDEKRIEFRKGFTLKEVKKGFVYNYKFWQKNTENITYFNRQIQLLPSSLYYFSGIEESDPSKMMFKFKDYWKGEFNYNKKKYTVAINGVNPYLDILIKPKNLPFSNTNLEYNINLKYQLNDTIRLSDSLFVLTNMDPNTTQLSFRKIKNTYGFKSNKIGTRIYDFNLKALEGREFKFSDYTTKEYTLIDFWGTWCIPCKKTTPKLKQMSKKYVQILNIIGVAYDKDIEEVKKYVLENKIDWVNSFSTRGKKDGLIKDLKINKYPTFILLNQSLEIIYKGAGEQSLEEIEKIIANKSI